MKNEIEKIVKGLFYQSEIDAPVKVLECQDLNYSTFFNSVTELKDWFGEAEIRQAENWLHLRKYLLNNFRHVYIYKIGETEKDILIICEDVDGKSICLQTKSVET